MRNHLLPKNLTSTSPFDPRKNITHARTLDILHSVILEDPADSIFPIPSPTSLPYHPSMLILASASPRRAQLLQAAGIPFQVIISPAHEPERKPKGIPTDLWPMALAYMKASAVQAKIENRKSKIENPPILAADTIVVAGAAPREKILNKARSKSHARKILSLLSGKPHRVITGCCLLRGEKVRLFSATATCRLKMSQRQLEEYLDSNLWQGKAGAYGIQDDTRDPFVTLLSGDVSTVVGLPIQLVQSELATF